MYARDPKSCKRSQEAQNTQENASYNTIRQEDEVEPYNNGDGLEKQPMQCISINTDVLTNKSKSPTESEEFKKLYPLTYTMKDQSYLISAS